MTLTGKMLVEMISLRRTYSRFFNEWLCPLVLGPVISSEARVDRIEWDGKSITLDTEATVMMIHIKEGKGIVIEDENIIVDTNYARGRFQVSHILTDKEIAKLAREIVYWLTTEKPDFEFFSPNSQMQPGPKHR